jgi:hypothetical protein
MVAPSALRALLLFPLLASIAQIACAGSDAKASPPKPGVLVSPVLITPEVAAVQPSPTATLVPTLAPSSTPVPPPPPTATPVPAAPTSSVQFKPPRVEQGGVAIVYLNEPAQSATLRFGGLTYQMLPDGNRWWAIVGVGALAGTGMAPGVVTYTAPGGTPTLQATGSLEIVDHDYPVESITLAPSTAALLAPAIVNAEIAQRRDYFATYTPQRLWSGPFVKPSLAVLSDTYGTGRSYNGAPVTDYHRGTDFAARTGDPIGASATGRVIFAGELKVRGNAVILDHGAGLFTAYHHLSRIDVAEGQAVGAGQQVGLAGETGLVTGPHLHWEVIIRGVEIDGLLFLQGTEIGP